MIANDVLRRVRFILDLDDSQMIAIFGKGGLEVTRAEVSDWLKREEDPAFVRCNDRRLAMFLNGLITERRGEREGPKPVPESRLTNNMILVKLKIAFNLKADDMLEILALSDVALSRHELSALFRKPTHKHYRECLDQVLRNFLNGLQVRFRQA